MAAFAAVHAGSGASNVGRGCRRLDSAGVSDRLVIGSTNRRHQSGVSRLETMSEPEPTSPQPTMAAPPVLLLHPEAGAQGKTDGWVLTAGERMYPPAQVEPGGKGLWLGGAAIALLAIGAASYVAYQDYTGSAPVVSGTAASPIAAVIEKPAAVAETAPVPKVEVRETAARGGEPAPEAAVTSKAADAASAPVEPAPAFRPEPPAAEPARLLHETGSLPVAAAPPQPAVAPTAPDPTRPAVVEPQRAPAQPTIVNTPVKTTPSPAPARKEAAPLPRESSRQVAAATQPRVMAGGPQPLPPVSDGPPRSARQASAGAAPPPPDRLRPPQVDSSDPVQVRAASVGLHPRLPRELLNKLSPTDLHNADVAIRTAVAEAPDGVPFRHPARPWEDDATFVVRIVPGGARDCRRYVVTVVKEGWSTTAPPMETCESGPQPRRF